MGIEGIEGVKGRIEEWKDGKMERNFKFRIVNGK